MASAPLKKSFNAAPTPDEMDDFIEQAGLGGFDTVVEFLGKYGDAVIGMQGGMGWTAFTNAAYGGQKDIVELFLSHGADVNGKGCYGETALLKAVQADGDKDGIVKLLLDRGVDIDARNKDGWTALMHASADGDKNMVVFLLKKGADPDLRDNEGETAFTHAQFHERYDVVSVLGQWPEEKKHLQEKEHEQWLTDTDCSKGLKNPLRAPRPLNLPKKRM